MLAPVAPVAAVVGVLCVAATPPGAWILPAVINLLLLLHCSDGFSVMMCMAGAVFTLCIGTSFHSCTPTSSMFPLGVAYDDSGACEVPPVVIVTVLVFEVAVAFVVSFLFHAYNLLLC